jgi:hypothetical protein
MPSFTPPVRQVGNNHVHQRPFRYYRHAVSMTVLYRNGHFTEVRVADPAETDLLKEGVTWFPGGRTYAISTETALLLEGDGYAFENFPAYGEGGYGQGTYGG